LEFLKASIADLITLFFSSLQNSEGGGNSAIVLLTPANFYHFQRPKFNFHPLSFTFETSKQKNRKNAFKSPAVKLQTIFYQNLPITAKVGGFLAAEIGIAEML
jgi:hypothetical protein